MKTHPTHTPPVPAREAGPRHGLLLAALSLALVVPLWGPITSTAEASSPAPSVSLGNEPAIPGLTDPPWLAWNTETLDEDTISNDPHAATDDDGRLWVAYVDEPNVVLGLQYRDEDGWHDANPPTDTGKPYDLAIGPDNQAWTLWSTHDCDSCLHTYNATTDTWTRIPAPFDADGAALAFGPDHEQLHIAFEHVGTPIYIKHATYNLTTENWTTETITHGSLGWMDLAVGPEERVHVAWTKHDDASTYALKDTDGSWTVKDYGDCDSDHALATDDTGTLHWVCKANAGVLYKQRTPEGDWANETAQDGSDLIPPRSPGHVGFHLDIAVDERNRPHIAYTTGMNLFFPDDPRTPEVPVYAVKLANGWHEHTIDRDGSSPGNHIGLTLDNHDRPHVAYTRSYRVWEFSCGSDINPCGHLRYAEPFAATAAWAAHGAAGEPVGLAS